jgi:hypothetical protein
MNNRPGQAADIELDRRAYVGEVLLRDPAPHRLTKGRVGIARLPGQVRQCSGEMNDVLAGAARDLQHKPGTGQHALQFGENRPLVAIGRGDEPAAVIELLTERFQHAVSSRDGRIAPRLTPRP